MKVFSRFLMCSMGMVLILGCSATSRNAIQVQPEGSENLVGDYRVSYSRDADTGRITVRIFDQAGNPKELQTDRIFCELATSDGRKQINWLDGVGYYPENTDYDSHHYPLAGGASEYSSHFRLASGSQLDSFRMWVPLPDGNRYEVTLVDDGVQGKPLTMTPQSSTMK